MKTNNPVPRTPREERIRAEAYVQGVARGKQEGFEAGKEATLNDLNKRNQLQNTILKAMEIQAAGMEMLTRMTSAIHILCGGKGLM